MKVSSWIVALNFGEGAGAQLHVLACTAPSAELAVAHCVSTVLQGLKIEAPLTRIVWQKLEEDFLVAALAQMRGENGEARVVNLHAVEPAPQVDQAPAHDWVLATNPMLSDRPGYACARCGDWREYTEPGGGTCVPRPL